MVPPFRGQFWEKKRRREEEREVSLGYVQKTEPIGICAVPSFPVPFSLGTTHAVDYCML